jgi:hypothetical protein
MKLVKRLTLRLSTQKFNTLYIIFVQNVIISFIVTTFVESRVNAFATNIKCKKHNITC